MNAYGWSQVALYALCAAIVLTVAAIAVFATLVFEVLVAPRTVRAITPKPVPA